ncbi:MAG TPA: zinc-ribbon domain-containing protein [Pyrinomonadaceae bacterium]|jgi:hypothetical protein
MVRTCPSCGAETAAEVRFCRHCGASLKAVAASENERISPLAQTVPLSGEGLTTSSLGADDPGGTASETKRVHRAEMEHLFSHTRFENAPNSQRDGDGSRSSSNVVSDYAAPQTGELARPVIDGDPASGARTPHAPAIKRSRRPRVLMAALLLLATLSGALVAYYFLRHRSTQKTSEATAASNSNQASESSSTASPVETATAETTADTVVVPPPQTEGTARPQPSAESSREARLRQERERAIPSPAVALPTPSPEASVSPVAQATPTPVQTPAPTPSPAVANRNAAQTGSEEFYFQAVNLVNGRDPRSLQRAELVRALQLFLNVKSGPHLGEAARQADRLGRELDRRRKQ